MLIGLKELASRGIRTVAEFLFDKVVRVGSFFFNSFIFLSLASF